MELRASWAPIWAECPGATQLTRVPETETEESREGDLCHLLAYLMINARLDFVDDHNETGLIVTDEYMALAEGAFEYCRTLQNDIINYHSEHHVMGGLLPESVEGTLDFACLDEHQTLHVVDFKFGFSSVSAVGNWQLLIYVLGVLVHYPEFKQVVVHIYQPRDYVGGCVKTWALSREELEAHRVELIKRAKEAREGGSLRTGPHCRFCDSRVYCEAFQLAASAVLEVVRFNAVDHAINPGLLGAEYAYLKRAEAIVVSARKAFEERILSEIEAGHPVAGWQIGRTSSKRYWSGSTEDVEAVGRLCGIKLTEPKPISITAAWKQKEARPLLETLISKGVGSQKLEPFNEAAVKEIFKDE